MRSFIRGLADLCLDLEIISDTIGIDLVGVIGVIAFGVPTLLILWILML